MRFLFGMLSFIWFAFVWECYLALSWEKPLPIPWHIEQNLQNTSEEFIDKSIMYAEVRLQSEEVDSIQRAHTHDALAIQYWMKAYQQDSRKTQIAYLKLALQQALSALSIMPEKPAFIYRSADSYHQLHQYEKALVLYEKALKFDPENPLVRRRYYELLDDMGQNGDEVKDPDL